MPGLDSGMLSAPDPARTQRFEDSFDPASLSHPGTGSIRVWTGSINAIRAPIAHEERPAPVFPEPAQSAPPVDRLSGGRLDFAVAPGEPSGADFGYPPPHAPGMSSQTLDASAQALAPAEAVPSFLPAEPVPPFVAEPARQPAAEPAEPPLFDPGLAEEFAGLLGQAPPGGPLEFLGEAEQPALPAWETSGWLTDASYAPDHEAPTALAPFRPIESPGETRDATMAAPSDVEDDETEFAGPPPLLPDGRPPWMEGPDASRTSPRGRPGRWVLQAILWVVAGIALGAAIWAATALLGDADLLAAGAVADAVDAAAGQIGV
ncbi:MAG: hypothetical protein LBL01_00100 [Bifidobacteriaceae bacterium]|jgi:hypothetical protein|nr:hypothetical protein [Bifidobacteriaceae bacterium]